jgi:hypothetical protein
MTTKHTNAEKRTSRRRAEWEMTGWSTVLGKFPLLEESEFVLQPKIREMSFP